MQVISQIDNLCEVSDKVRRPKIIAVGGGKGGIGKTIISVNLAVALTWQKNKVIVVDADLGGANLHTCLGVNITGPTLSDYITEEVLDLNQTIVKTGISDLKLISGAQDSLNVANITNVQKTRFISALRTLDADYVILDLGAGTSYSVIDFFLASDNGLLVMLPEPTSVENVYRFIKVAFYRRLRSLENSMKLEKLVSNVMKETDENDIKTPLQLLEAIRKTNNKMADKLYSEMLKFNPNVIVNMVRTTMDIEMGSSVSFACKRYFGIKVGYLGHINYSNHIWQSIRNRRPVIMDFPNSTTVTNFSNILRNLREKQ